MRIGILKAVSLAAVFAIALPMAAHADSAPAIKAAPVKAVHHVVHHRHIVHHVTHHVVHHAPKPAVQKS